MRVNTRPWAPDETAQLARNVAALEREYGYAHLRDHVAEWESLALARRLAAGIEHRCLFAIILAFHQCARSALPFSPVCRGARKRAFVCA